MILGLVTAACISNAPRGPSNQDKVEAYYQIGLSFFEEGRYPEAIGKFQDAYALDPQRYDILMNLGMTYMKVEKWDLALAKTSEACLAAKVYPECWNNLAIIYLKRGNAPKAKDSAKRALSVTTYSTPELALSNLARAHMLVGENRDARRELEKALRLNPEACAPRVLLGKTWLRLNEPEEALREVKIALARCPMAPEAHLWQAYIYYKLGQRRSARLKYEQIMELYKQGEVNDVSRLNLERLEKKVPLREPVL